MPYYYIFYPYVIINYVYCYYKLLSYYFNKLKSSYGSEVNPLREIKFTELILHIIFYIF